jgi:hypothetical protein
MPRECGWSLPARRLLSTGTDWVCFDELARGVDPNSSPPAIAAASTAAALIRSVRESSFIPASADTERSNLSLEPLSHERLAQNARALTTRGDIRVGDNVLAGSGLGLGDQLEHILPSWLLCGFCLNFAEEAATENADRRELGPSVVFGASRAYADLAEQVAANLPPRDRLAGRWLHGWLGGRGAHGRLARRLLTARLREVLGLARVRSAVALGDSVPAASSFEWLFGLSLFEWPEHATRARELTPVASADGVAPLAALARSFDGAELGAASRSDLA